MSAVDQSQRRAARVVGVLYLVLMAVGMFSQIYVPGGFPGTVPEHSTGTAAELVGSVPLFRLAAALDILVFAGDAALAVAYYILLRKVNQAVALLGAFWRLAQVAILTGYTITSVVVLQLLSGEPEVRALTADQATALAWVALTTHTIGFNIGLVFLGLGSVAFSYLLLKSGYLPRIFGGWGMFSSALLAAGGLVSIALPAATPVVNPAMFVPMFFFEVGTGLWLLIRGLKNPATV